MSYTPTGHSSDGAWTREVPINAFAGSYTDHWVVTKNGTSEAILACTDAPLVATSTIRFARSTIGNIFSASGISRPSPNVSTKGFAILAQMNDFIVMHDEAADPDTIYLPISAHVVFRFHEATPTIDTMLRAATQRLLGTLLEQDGTDVGPRLNALARGSLLPVSLR